MAPRGFNKYFIVIGAGRNKKFVRLTDSERCAHVFGILSLAAQSPRRGYLLITDGEEVAAEEISNEAGGSVTVKVAQSALAKLKRLGVLKRDDEVGAWFVHDWWDVNPDPRVDSTNAERQARYRANSKAQSNASNGSSNATVTASNAGEVEGEVEEPSTANAVAVPATPALTDLDRQIEEVCDHFSQQVRATHGIAPSSREGRVVKGWRDACRSMLTLDGLTAEQVQYAGAWVCRHHYWKNRVKSMTRLRSEMPQIAKDIREQRDGGSVVRLAGRKPSAGDLINKINGGDAA